MLYSKLLDSEEMIVEKFLPAMNAFACGWGRIKPVTVYMLAILLDKTQKRGLSLVKSTLSLKVSIIQSHV